MSAIIEKHVYVGAMPRWEKTARVAEDLIVTASLALMAVLPIAEVVFRKIFHSGIAGSAAFVQHLVLFIAMLGAAIAAREGRLLSLSTASYLKGHWKVRAKMAANSFTAALCILLCAAAMEFVMTRRTMGETLPYGIPLWAIQLVLPAGFGLVAARLIWQSSPGPRGRLLAAVLAGGLVWIAAKPPLPPSLLMMPALVALGAATILGMPVFATLGGAALILFWGAGQTTAVIPIDHYRLVVNPTLPTIPLFTLAGFFLAESGASQRLIRVFQALFGWIRGGPAVVTALVCAFFTSFTGASGVTILALGGLLMPVLSAAHYSDKQALGLLTGAGSLGLLLPPCLPLILYSVVSTSAGVEVSVRQMFLGGIAPGLLMVALIACWGIVKEPAGGMAPRRFDAAEAVRAIGAAKWELAVPPVALIALFGGFATPVEAAAITALYAFTAVTVIHRDLMPLRDVPRIMTECGLLVGGVLLILGVAMGLTDYFFDARIPERISGWAQSAIHSRWMFLLALNLVLIVVGCLMDIFSAIVVMAPLIIPLGRAFGIDPIHLGIIFLANLELGYLTPPVGMNLFLASYRFNRPIGEVIKASLPMLLVLLTGVLVTTYFPPLVTTLPRMFP